MNAYFPISQHGLTDTTSKPTRFGRCRDMTFILACASRGDVCVGIAGRLSWRDCAGLGIDVGRGRDKESESG